LAIKLFSRSASLVCLCLALLIAQWQGLAHSIGHADIQKSTHLEIKIKNSHDAHADCEGGQQHGYHHCAAYDAVTLGALYGLPSFLIALLELEQAKIRFYETYQVSLPPPLPFEARAPPALNS
jgi:hypothetical protein